MTISTTSNRAQWSGNGATASFSFSFEIGSASQAALYFTDTTGATTLVPPSSYSISGIGAPNGGTITYPLSGSPIASGTTLTLVRTVALQQLVDLINQSNYFPDAVEGALDYLMMALQQIASQALHSLQVPVSENPASNALTLPGSAARALALVGFDANGNVITYPVPASVGAGSLTLEGPFQSGPGFTPGVTTTLTLTQAYGSPVNVSVHFDSAWQGPDQYTLDGDLLIFNSPIPEGVSTVYVVGGTTLSAYIPSFGSVGPSQMQENSVGAVQLQDSAVGDAQLAWGGVLPRIVASLAALRALSSTVYQEAIAVGDGAAGDGLYLHYRVNASDTTSPDNGGSIIVGNDGARWYQVTGARNSNAFHQALGAIIARYGDRLFVGDATVASGTPSTSPYDWLTTFQRSTGGLGWGDAEFSQFVSLGDQSAESLVAGVFGMQTLYANQNRDYTAIQGFAINNGTTYLTNCWGLYGEGQQLTTTAGATYGAELDVRCATQFTYIDPYTTNTKQAIAVQVAAGAGFTGAQYAASAAINIQDNNAQFNIGINIGSNALVGDTGSAGSAMAMALGFGHCLQWFGGANTKTSRIGCFATSSTDSMNLQFYDGYSIFLNSNGVGAFQVGNVSNAANFLVTTPAATGAPPSLYAAGSDTNIDLLLNGQGTGNVRFGTYTGGTVAQAGYITIKDFGGTTRRLLVG